MSYMERKILEKDIQFSICSWLSTRKGIVFWRQNTNPIINNKTGNFRAMPKFSMNGIPDIIVIKDGKFIGLEVKRPKGKQSDSQIEFERRVKNVGAEYFVVTSIDDVMKIL